LKVRQIVKREVDAPDLAQRIKDAQKRSGQSVSRICKDLGISRAYWYRLVAGKEESISEDLLRSIERLLNVDFGIVFNKEGEAEGDRS
jgi:transcriptional regulator with XRE-family HTH domain